MGTPRRRSVKAAGLVVLLAAAVVVAVLLAGSSSVRHPAAVGRKSQQQPNASGDLSSPTPVIVDWSGGSPGAGGYIDSNGTFPTATLVFSTSSAYQGNATVDMYVLSPSQSTPATPADAASSSVQDAAIWDYSRMNGHPMTVSTSTSGDNIQWPLVDNSGNPVGNGTYRVFVAVSLNGQPVGDSEGDFVVSSENAG